MLNKAVTGLGRRGVPKRLDVPAMSALSGEKGGTPVPRLLVNVEEAAEALAVSRTALYDLLRAGEIQTIHIGRSVRVPVAALEAYVARRAGADARR
jgi:excisionase family DNA binding protein